jgi:hypothetical protein
MGNCNGTPKKNFLGVIDFTSYGNVQIDMISGDCDVRTEVHDPCEGIEYIQVNAKWLDKTYRFAKYIGIAEKGVIVYILYRNCRPEEFSKRDVKANFRDQFPPEDLQVIDQFCRTHQLPLP